MNAGEGPMRADPSGQRHRHGRKDGVQQKIEDGDRKDDQIPDTFQASTLRFLHPLEGTSRREVQITSAEFSVLVRNNFENG